MVKTNISSDINELGDMSNNDKILITRFQIARDAIYGLV